MSIRASEADVVLRCAAASVKPEHEIDFESPEAALGAEVHLILEDWVNRGFEGQPEGPPNEAGDLAAAAVPIIEHIRAVEPLYGARAEVALKDDLCRGRLDVASISADRVSIIDWKTGRKTDDNAYHGQMAAYASLAYGAHGMPSSGYVYTAIAWLRTGNITERRFELQHIDDFRKRLKYQLGNPERFAPGEHCTWCRHRVECYPREQYFRSSCAAIAEVKAPLTPQAIADLWDKSRAVKQALAQYEKAVDAILVDGPIEFPDGRTLRSIERKRKEINARAAWRIMQQYGLTPDDINEVLSVSKTALLDKVGARTERGKKGGAKKQIMADLADAGAVEDKPYNIKVMFKAKG